MQYHQAYDFLIPKLKSGLSDTLTYHDTYHTLDVIDKAVHIAMGEGIVDDKTLALIKTAALFHDFGFVKSNTNHEETSCDFAKQYLPYFDYSIEDIDQICTMIMATKVPQNPLNKHSEILCDADLYYLGTDKYEDRSHKLFNEFQHSGIITNPELWLSIQIAFLTNHTFFTATAQKECGPGKQKVLDNLLILKTGNTSKKHSIKTFLKSHLNKILNFTKI
jgi:uncharacterized protein